jgi:hypothetical protein
MKHARLIASVVALLLTRCHPGDSVDSREKGRFTTMDIQHLGTRLGISLPPGTRILGVTSESGIDELLRAKLEMPIASLEKFLASTGIPHFETVGPDFLGPDEGFWDPHRAKGLRCGDVQLPGSRFLTIAVDESRPGVAVVYAMNNGT